MRRIILVLLFPFLMLVMMVAVYTSGMHAPQPHHMKVAVVGEPAVAAPLARSLETAADGAYDVEVVPSAERAREMVQERDVAAAYVTAPQPDDRTAGVAGTAFAQPPNPDGPLLYVASGGGASRATMAATPFQNIAVQQGEFLQVRDLVPLHDGDTTGTTLLYSAIGLTLAGYLPMIILPMAVPDASRRIALGILAGWGVVASFVTWLITGPIIGAVQGSVPSFLFTGWLTVLAVGTGTWFLSRVFGRLATLPAIFLFMFVAVPASGAALPIEAMPAFFRGLHDVLPMTSTAESLRGLMYFGSDGIGGHWLILAVWAAAALVATLGVDALKARCAADEPPSSSSGSSASSADEAQELVNTATS